ncbi:MAG: G1 family glutamic endopeptidase [Solirubrobacteraceae bacterium]
MRRTVGLLAAVLSLGAAAPAMAVSTSSNWAGYAASGKGARFRAVSATWVVAPVRCAGGRRTYSAAWIGLGGYHTSARALEQTGTEADCDRAGGAHYSAWLEIVPAPSVRLPMGVRAGDTISASVTVSGRRVHVVIADRTSGGRISRYLTADRTDVTSAEWIVEAPSVCFAQGCTVLALADFGTQGFTSARATSAAGHQGTISDPAWATSAIGLSAASSTDLGPGRFAADQASATATPGPLTPAGDAFDVAFAAAPTSGDSSPVGTPPGR